MKNIKVIIEFQIESTEDGVDAKEERKGLVDEVYKDIHKHIKSTYPQQKFSSIIELEKLEVK